ncbi:MAG: lipocalin family protein [Chitinophagaceae bacterium]
MKRLFAVTIISTLLFASCSKDKQDATASPYELLQGRWYLEKTTSAAGEVDVASSCEKKSYFDFKKDGSLTNVNYAISMGECKPTLNAAVYELSDDGKELKVSTEDGLITGSFEVITLTDNTLELSNSIDYITTFKK